MGIGIAMDSAVAFDTVSEVHVNRGRHRKVARPLYPRSLVSCTGTDDRIGDHTRRDPRFHQHASSAASASGSSVGPVQGSANVVGHAGTPTIPM